MLFLGFVLQFHLNWVLIDLFLGNLIVDESLLCAYTEIANCEQNDFFENCVPRELMGIVNVKGQFFDSERLEMHNISDIEIKNPVIVLFSH